MVLASTWIATLVNQVGRGLRVSALFSVCVWFLCVCLVVFVSSQHASSLMDSGDELEDGEDGDGFSLDLDSDLGEPGK